MICTSSSCWSLIAAAPSSSKSSSEISSTEPARMVRVTPGMQRRSAFRNMRGGRLGIVWSMAQSVWTPLWTDASTYMTLSRFPLHPRVWQGKRSELRMAMSKTRTSPTISHILLDSSGDPPEGTPPSTRVPLPLSLFTSSIPWSAAAAAAVAASTEARLVATAWAGLSRAGRTRLKVRLREPWTNSNRSPHCRSSRESSRALQVACMYLRDRFRA
mmetsp:Transcript_7815/g.22193  ORF Transcript_7815/g.22193 Transcript_7815/m.22193 type:complete len:215 (-) Transcript_7815:1919-2563(-)